MHRSWQWNGARVKMIMKASEIGDAIVEYLAERGVKTDLNHVYLGYDQDSNSRVIQARIEDIKLEIGAPYR